MKIFLIIWGLVSAGYAGFVLTVAKSAVHEILAGVALVIFTLSLGFAGVIEAVDKTRAAHK
jgi:hypothetical protein